MNPEGGWMPCLAMGLPERVRDRLLTTG